MNYQIDRKDELITLIPKDHKHTVIWIHGLAYYPQSNLNELIQSLGDNIQFTKVLIPRAPIRYVTVMQKQTRSWFDIKFRGKKSFQVPFDQAFSSDEVHDSYQNVLKPLIDQQRQILDKKQPKGLIIVSGFSQGCGMSLHCLYETQKIDAALGIAGYLFPFSKFDAESKKPKRIIYGLSDKLRPWQQVKVAYEGKIQQKYFRFVQDMGHQLTIQTVKQMKYFFDQLLKK